MSTFLCRYIFMFVCVLSLSVFFSVFYIGLDAWNKIDWLIDWQVHIIMPDIDINIPSAPYFGAVSPPSPWIDATAGSPRKKWLDQIRTENDTHSHWHWPTCGDPPSVETAPGWRNSWLHDNDVDVDNDICEIPGHASDSENADSPMLVQEIGTVYVLPARLRNTLVGRLRPWSARGRLQAKPERLFFVILVTHPKSYIETMDRRDFGGKPLKWRWGRVLSWKILEFCSVGGARPKNSIFRVFRVPSTVLRTAYREQMRSRDSEGVPFA